MKDASQVLQQKEVELSRVRKEIESLSIVAGLLADGEEPADDPGRTSLDSQKKPSSSASENSHHLETEVGSQFLSALKRAR
jgi:hypothetical protein